MSALLLRDPAAADRVRHLEGAVEHDVGDGAEGAVREVLRAADEIAGGVVDEVRVGGAGVPGGGHGALHRVRVLDVHRLPARHAGVRVVHLRRRLLHDGRAAAPDLHRGAEREQPLRHHPAEAGAAAGDEHALAGEEVVLEHAVSSLVPRRCCRSARGMTARPRGRSLRGGRVVGTGRSAWRERRVLLVTGGGRGIGAAVARLAAGRGYDVCLTFLGDAARAEDTAAAARDAGARALAVRADVADGRRGSGVSPRWTPSGAAGWTRW